MRRPGAGVGSLCLHATAGCRAPSGSALHSRSMRYYMEYVWMRYEWMRYYMLYEWKRSP
jgi:hypothetical protein